MGSLVVVVPLKPGMVDRARELLAEGPPFDLEETGFDRHTVHVSNQEIVFVFEGEGPDSTLKLPGEKPEVWRAAAAWQDCLAGPPRIARRAFAWQRSSEPRGLSFEPTPGPGDSEGGDVYSPVTPETRAPIK
jgi:hypothetical protein